MLDYLYSAIVLQFCSKRKQTAPTREPYLERDARSNTLDPDEAHGYVARVRLRSKGAILARELELDAGLEHHSPALVRDLERELDNQPSPD
jgi:hypothetical protein